MASSAAFEPEMVRFTSMKFFEYLPYRDEETRPLPSPSYAELPVQHRTAVNQEPTYDHMSYEYYHAP